MQAKGQLAEKRELVCSGPCGLTVPLHRPGAAEPATGSTQVRVDSAYNLSQWVARFADPTNLKYGRGRDGSGSRSSSRASGNIDASHVATYFARRIAGASRAPKHSLRHRSRIKTTAPLPRARSGYRNESVRSLTGRPSGSARQDSPGEIDCGPTSVPVLMSSPALSGTGSI